MRYDKSNWTTCVRPRRDDVVVHPVKGVVVGTVDRVRSNGAVIVRFDSSWPFAHYVPMGELMCGEHWETLFERGMLVLVRESN